VRLSVFKAVTEPAAPQVLTAKGTLEIDEVAVGYVKQLLAQLDHLNGKPFGNAVKPLTPRAEFTCASQSHSHTQWRAALLVYFATVKGSTPTLTATQRCVAARICWQDTTSAKPDELAVCFAQALRTALQPWLSDTKASPSLWSILLRHLNSSADSDGVIYIALSNLVDGVHLQKSFASPSTLCDAVAGVWSMAEAVVVLADELDHWVKGPNRLVGETMLPEKQVTLLGTTAHIEWAWQDLPHALTAMLGCRSTTAGLVLPRV
jgi:hypothetical protein